MSRSAEHDARNAALKQALGTNELAKAASQPTAQTVPAQCKELQLQWTVEDIPDSEGAKVHWIGKRDANTVLVYFHGGGFGLSAFPGHVQFLASCIEKSNGNLVVAMIEYGLTPAIKYPTQYLQAIQATRHVISSGYPASSIIVGGDSAGGNMALTLLSIVKHPLPSIPKLDLESPLKGALLICPWVSFTTDWDSYKENEDRDIHSGTTMKIWASDFASSTERNNYSEAVRADVDWWKGLQVDNILLTWGEWELFKDSNEQLAKTLASAGLNVKPVGCAKQVHIDCVLDSQSGLPHGQMSEAVWDWLKTVC